MNQATIKYILEIMKPNELIEIRSIQGKNTTSGYFKDIDTLVNAIEQLENNNIYFILNEINDACYSREQKDNMFSFPSNTTADNDIVRRKWLLIDIDTKRATGVSATDKEKLHSKDVANKVFKYLRDIGFSSPICTDSGNGYHLLYKIDLPNDSVSKEILKNFLKSLDFLFTIDGAEIDKQVYNAARITKLYGTFARKGRSTEERPHRESKIISVPDEIKETPLELIKRVADFLPKKDKPTRGNIYSNEKFDLDSFISKHNILVTSTQGYGDGTKYILENCIFDHNHKGKDACLIQMSNGAIAYKCFHNSCSNYKWQDVRIKFEPTAYDKRLEYSNRTIKKESPKPQIEKEEKGKKFRTLSEIKSVDRSKIVSIPSKFNELDKKIIGFNKGEVSLWSGKNGSAKSTVISHVVLNGINSGFNFLVFSGELTGHRIKNWFHLQASGRQFNLPSKWEGVFYTPKDISKKIDDWLNDKLWVYNNDYGNNFEQLLTDIEDFISKKDIDCIVIDNLMALNLNNLDGFKNEKQTTFINKISKFAKDKDIHIHLVAHPRKNVGFLRKDDISGTADLTNAVDNVLICHRNNIDFQKSSSEFFPHSMSQLLSEYSNYIEVCKNRDLGVVDLLIGLHFEIESKRLLNYKHENLCYDWQDGTIAQPLTPQPDYNPDAHIEPNKEFEEDIYNDLPF